MAATIRDIAKLAKVSPATVSRYFSGSNVVGDELGKRIAEATDTLQYLPGPGDKKRTAQGVIIVLVPHLRLGYFGEVLKEIMEQMPKFKYRIIIVPTIPGDDSYKRMFKELYVTGAVYLDEDIDKDMLRYIQDKNIKVVMLGGAAYGSRCDMVHINDMAAAYEGMKYLLELNHRHILILSDYARSLSSGTQRLMGCRQALEEYGITLNREEMVEFGSLTFENGYRSAAEALKEGKHFTAIFAFSDETAMGAIQALYRRGLKVPEDISVLGFDGISISSRIIPELSTIYQPIDRMVEWTLNTFCSDKGRTKAPNVEYTLPYKLLKRGTTADLSCSNAGEAADISCSNVGPLET